MKGIVAEINGKYAVILTQDGLFKRVRAMSYMKPGVEIDLDQPSASKNSRTVMKIASIAAACLLALGIGAGVYSYTIPYSYVDLDINPSIELTVNIYDRIINVEPLNEDGNMLISNIRLKHMKLDIGISTLLNSAVEQGYLKQPQGDAGQQSGVYVTEGSDGQQQPYGDASDAKGNAADQNTAGPDTPGTNKPDPNTTGGNGDTTPSGAGSDAENDRKIKNAVLLTVSSNNARKADSIKKNLEEAASKELKKENVKSKILVARTSVEQRDAARKLGVTPGKLALIESAMKNAPEIDLEEARNTAVKDLLELARDKMPEQKRKQEHNENAGTAGDGKKGGGNGNEAGSGRTENGGRKNGETGSGKIGGINKSPANSKNVGNSSNISSAGNKKSSSDKNSRNSNKNDSNAGSAGNSSNRNAKKSINEALEQYGEKLKEEREHLREELLKQALSNGENRNRGDDNEDRKRADAVKSRDDGNNRTGAGAGKSRNEDDDRGGSKKGGKDNNANKSNKGGSRNQNSVNQKKQNGKTGKK